MSMHELYRKLNGSLRPSSYASDEIYLESPSNQHHYHVRPIRCRDDILLLLDSRRIRACVLVLVNNERD